MEYIYVINGSNLNMLGLREAEIYGNQTLMQIKEACEIAVKNSPYKIKFLQSNHEGDLVDYIQQAIVDGAAIVINAGAYTHTSIAILDALLIFPHLVVEVHLSNIYKRENFRQCSYCSKRADAVIMGCGSKGYKQAIEYILSAQEN